MKKIALIFLFLGCFFSISNVFAEQYCPEDGGACYDVQPLKDIPASWDSAWSASSGYSPCRYNEWASLWAFLNGCKPKTVVGGSDMRVEWGFKSKINKWIANLSVFLWVMAVGSIVYAAFLMQISGGADEQIKKGKNIVKYTIMWFLWLIMASWIVYLVINVMFWLWS